MSSDKSSYDHDLDRKRKNKRRKGADGLPTSNSLPPTEDFSFQPLLDVLEDNTAASLEESISPLLPDYLRQRDLLREKESEKDAMGQMLRPLTASDVSSLLSAAPNTGSHSFAQAVAIRKLKVAQERGRAGYEGKGTWNLSPNSVDQLPSPSPALSEHTGTIIEALESIKTTLYENSFLSRLHGVARGAASIPNLVSVDWETVTPWMSLMNDVREHYTFAHPERDPPSNTVSPIAYAALQPWHLDQVHDLLERAFWSGIDVSDSLDYSPERCTIIATYGRLVVGAAIISSPRETYITYLVVRAGWDNAQIATTMLYHLITLNPHQDITLHVSANSSAMLLYNRFGFKAEEFVAGFYEAYLDPQSRASKNAFRLRLRQH